MPKILNLLPCPNPECGHTIPMLYSKPTISFVLCPECIVAGPEYNSDIRAIAAWNAMPRALVWTTEPPSEAGHYWCRYKIEGKELWSVSYVPAVTDWDKRDMDEHYRIEWAGPIPLPKEPNP